MTRLKSVEAVRTPVVRIEGLTKLYNNGDRQVAIFEDVSLRIEAGAFFAILGASGSGKTSLLNIMGGLDRPSSGEVEVCGQALGALSEQQRSAFRRDHLGFVFQFFNLLPTLSALENVKVALELSRLSRAVVDSRAYEYLEAVGLGDKAHRRPAQLSGGEQQRVAIARALAKQPELVLLDEPTGNLDRENADAVLDLMQTLNKRLGTTFVVVTHDQEIGAMADATYYVGARSRPVTRSFVRLGAAHE
jgi:ABC-type lipoprotein export system ATPase subunit